MRRLGPFFSCLLLALWFTAMLHCSLEAAVLSGSDDGDGDGGRCSCCQGTTGADDGCSTNETGAFKPANDTPKVPHPDLFACACHICLSLALPSAPLDLQTGSVDSVHRPQEWVAKWSFVRRAALSPRAPSLLTA